MAKVEGPMRGITRFGRLQVPTGTCCLTPEGFTGIRLRSGTSLVSGTHETD